MSPLADAFHSSFDDWFTELFGQLNTVSNMSLWVAEVVAFFCLMQSYNKPLTIDTVVEAV